MYYYKLLQKIWFFYVFFILHFNKYPFIIGLSIQINREINSHVHSSNLNEIYSNNNSNIYTVDRRRFEIIIRSFGSWSFCLHKRMLRSNMSKNWIIWVWKWQNIVTLSKKPKFKKNAYQRKKYWLVYNVHKADFFGSH